MNNRPVRALRLLSSAALTWVALVSAPTLAGVVTLSVKGRSGVSGEDTIIALDPLEASPPPGHNAALIDQIDKKFVPKVNVIRTGTAVTFPNSDRIRHQVYSFSQSKIFSLKLYAGSPHVEVVFDKPGLVVLGCNIHDSMIAFVAVVDTPYFAKIPSSGTVDLTVPSGRYRMRVWHPGLSVPVAPREVVVGKDPLAIPLTVDLDPTSEAVAEWPE